MKLFGWLVSCVIGNPVAGTAIQRGTRWYPSSRIE
jgi:hypothetical protein